MGRIAVFIIILKDQIHNKIDDKYNNLVQLLKQQMLTEMILSLKQLILENLHIHLSISEVNIQEKQPPALHSTAFDILLEKK